MTTEAGDRAAAIAELLRHYDRLLLAADHAPPVIWVRARPHRGGRWDVWRLPRPTLLLRFFVRLHVRRGVQALRRRLSAERALARGGSALADEHDAVVRYEDAIPPLHGRAIAVALAAAVLIIGRLAVQYAGQLLSSVPALTHVQRGDIRSGSSVERPIAF